MTAAGVACSACGNPLREGARFCDDCGLAVAQQVRPAEYKQVTVLFADVVESMDLAAAVETERLREIMSSVFTRSATVVQRYGGTVDKFTGDGIMALFGAPVALEDHAFRACLAALDIQREMTRLAGEAQRLDGVDLRLRIGLNSGQVITGDIDAGPGGGYTAIGVQVGMAQRMESVAPPGGVMLSESTARLVSDTVALAEAETVHVKGSSAPVTAFRLLGSGDQRRYRRHETTLVGRGWELAALKGILQNALAGSGGVVGLTGPPGIGKSRMVAELAEEAAARGAGVFRTSCEAHARDVPFHAVAGLLRTVFGVDGVEPDVGRARLRGRLPMAGAEDLVLLDDLLGIREAGAQMLDIDPDARRRRLTALIKTASLARKTPTVYVIEDVHWIDDVSDSMVADFVAVVPQTSSLVVTTYRPEYRGELTRIPRAQAFTLAPLGDQEIVALADELLGRDPSLRGLGRRIAERAAGNPFFVEEIVRDLAERGVLSGQRGAYQAGGDVADINVPSTLHATIAARVDRLGTAAKRTLTAAAAIGSQFSEALVARLVEPIDLAALVDAELVDQVVFAPHAEYAFRHPLIRAVAYESQLKSTRADLHRRLATTIELDEPESADENAALIAEHLFAAGDFVSSYAWHMRAATWAQTRFVDAAKTSWLRARDVADLLPDDHPERTQKRMAPRVLLCMNANRTGGAVDDLRFDELRHLAEESGDKTSLAMGLAGLIISLTFNNRIAEAISYSDELVTLADALDQQLLTVALLGAPLAAKMQAGDGQATLLIAQRAIDIAERSGADQHVMAPLAIAYAFRGFAEVMLGTEGFVESFDHALELARPIDPTTFAVAASYKHCCLTLGALDSDDSTARVCEEVLAFAERAGDRLALGTALIARAIVLFHRGGADADAACELFRRAREVGLDHHRVFISVADLHLAMRRLQLGDLDGAITMARGVADGCVASGDGIWLGAATTTLVEALLATNTEPGLVRAVAATDLLQDQIPATGRALYELPLLRSRALIARARGDDREYRHYVTRYQTRAHECGFVGHIRIARAMAQASAPT